MPPIGFSAMPLYEWRGDEVTVAMKKAAMKAIMRGTESVKTRVIEHLNDGNKTGRIYVRNTVSHQASAPGETPATDKGDLAKSIVTEYFPEEIAGRVDANIKYAESLEFGTSRMEPRPFMRRSLTEMYPKIQADVAKEIAKVLK